MKRLAETVLHVGGGNPQTPPAGARHVAVTPPPLPTAEPTWRQPRWDAVGAAGGRHRAVGSVSSRLKESRFK